MALAVRRLPVGASLAFQPVVWLRDLTLAGYEVLLRGVADPAVFFADAVRGGWACELDAEVCRMAAAAVPFLDPEAMLFVNLTPQSFLAGGAAQEALAGEPRGRVVVEVTEHAFSTAPGELARATAGWRGAGFRLAVDDVGSGQSRLLALA
ncbi:MAG: EAL domain-containing protein, partial [Bacillota bacterium]